MRKKYQNAGLLLCLAVIIMMIAISCGSEEEKGATLSGDVSELVRYYHTMKQVGLAGRVDEFLDMRDSLTRAEIDSYYSWKGWTFDSIKVSDMAYHWPDIAGMALEQDTTYELWRRLVFRQCELYDTAGKEQCLYPVVLFRKNGDVWKVSNASRLASYRYNDDGSLRTLDQLSFHKLFRLPPDFIDLKKKERPSDYQIQPAQTQDTTRRK
jgi:hypothetical protein